MPWRVMIGEAIDIMISASLAGVLDATVGLRLIPSVTPQFLP